MLRGCELETHVSPPIFEELLTLQRRVIASLRRGGDVASSTPALVRDLEALARRLPAPVDIIDATPPSRPVRVH